MFWRLKLWEISVVQFLPTIELCDLHAKELKENLQAAPETR